MFYKEFFKRLLDVFASLFGLILLSPIFLIITVLLTFYNRGSAFFFQRRPGKNEKIFKVVKFKTMTDNKDKQGQLLPDAKRLTGLGKFIRKTSLDEIPQLFNVLKGDMSLIGPRPLLPEYLSLYNEFQKTRHYVKPGITGWAQVNGRNAISWEKKFEYDVWYVQKISFILDLKILLLTVIKVFKSEGINNQGQATTTPFLGNE
ncbi:lipid carrier--UDP-N-acetylgalactosaminyltransferase [Winogradskyella sp. PC-19]|uniref:sugar transferase n=1 Tax=Winogradskyella sp. PC-19 TaxID=754417 RepID=UPI000B3C6EA5|nr:sugar transferase [Winogradskyella sp. PC-19]ARV09684.1 lipid carrier--UDP-N-acetylgalactosaminyltransferase [Winogradskyella sp. PC-19]